MTFMVINNAMEEFDVFKDEEFEFWRDKTRIFSWGVNYLNIVRGINRFSISDMFQRAHFEF